MRDWIYANIVLPHRLRKPGWWAKHWHYFALVVTGFAFPATPWLLFGFTEYGLLCGAMGAVIAPLGAWLDR